MRLLSLVLGLLLFQDSIGATAHDAGPVAVPEPSEKAMSYYYTRTTLWLIGIVWGLVIPALFLFTGWSAKIRDGARRISSRWALTIFFYLAIYSAITFVIGLPLAYYGEYAVERQFGLSDQAFSKWLVDSLIALGVSIVIGTLVLLGIYQLLRKSPRRWWLYAGLMAIPFVFVLVLVTPIWIEPLFNKFGPMKDTALEAKIHALADKAGIEGARIFEVEKSVDTKKLNAYVTGFMDTKRIVLWDTILKRLDQPQLLFVVGHEMGHYVLGHIWRLILFICALIMLALYGAHRLSHGLIKRYSHRFKFDRLDDVASWPLISLVAGAILLVALPALNAFSRYQEHEADRFGLEITRNNHAAASAFVRLQVEDLENPRPNPILQLWRGGHPTLADRIEFSNTYRPWEKGEPLKYADRFKK